MHGISDNLEFRVVGAPVANGSATDSNTSRIDMAGYESVVFVAPITDSAATAVATLTIEANDADSDTGMAPVEGTAATATCVDADDINGTVLVAELRKPGKRYVQAVRTSATANIAFGSVIAILKPHRRPAEQGVTIADAAYVSG